MSIDNARISSDTMSVHLRGLVQCKGDGGSGGRDEGSDDEEDESNFMHREAVRLPENCPACKAPGESLTCMTDIPHFKEVMIMAFDCEYCGFKTSEVRV